MPMPMSLDDFLTKQNSEKSEREEKYKEFFNCIKPELEVMMRNIVNDAMNKIVDKNKEENKN